MMNTTLEYIAIPLSNLTNNGSTTSPSDADLGRMINIIARPCIVAFGTVGKRSYDLHFPLNVFQMQPSHGKHHRLQSGVCVT